MTVSGGTRAFYSARQPRCAGPAERAFPLPNLAGCGWVAPGLLLATALGTRGGQSFRLGYVAGLAHYLASLYWLLLIPYRWHGIPLGPGLGWLALGAFLALYPATWVWLCVKVSGAKSEVPGSGAGSTAAIRNLSLPHWTQRTAWALFCAAAWVALEMLITRLFGGFPWNLLGASQYRLVPLIQIASVTGVYGVSFLLVWTSVSLLNAMRTVLLRPAWRSVWIADILLPGLAVFALFVSGYQHLQHLPEPERKLKVTLVQPGIPQTLIWDADRNLERFADLLRLSEQALTNQTDLLIWPEAAVPSFAAWDTNIFPAITNLAREHRVWLILGSDDLGRLEHPTASEKYEYYNASFLVNPDGQFVSRYKKRNLVIFGEYVPLVRWLPFLKWFTPIEGGFTPGDRPVPFELDGWGGRPREPQAETNDGSRVRSPHPRVKTSVLICFEDIFPQLGRDSVEPDTDFLVNLTNDGWFGEGAAQWQQAACAIFRAVENGVPLVRCANTGLTGWADAGGRLRQIFADDRGSVYGVGYLTAEIPLLRPGEPRAPTFYRQHGDWFGWGCVGVALLTLVLVRFRKNS